jgi:glycosyltransferase involved in cell wall biosynthesis
MPTIWRDCTAIVATHNRAALLQRCILAIKANFLQASQILVIDDGSVDATPSLAPWLQALGCQLISTRAKGAASARNLALRAATTPWVAFCDDDDIWLPNHLAQARETLSGSSPALYAAPMLVFNAGGGEGAWSLPRWTCHAPHGLLDLLPWPCTLTSAVVVPRQTAIDAGGFHETAMIEDVPLWWHLATRLPILHGQIPSVQYWWHDASLTHRPGHQGTAPLAFIPVLQQLALADSSINTIVKRIEVQLATTGVYPGPLPLDHLTPHRAQELLRRAYRRPAQLESPLSTSL